MISVVIPALILNEELNEMLHRAIISVIDTCDNLTEIIVVDNGSPKFEMYFNPNRNSVIRWMRFERNQGYARAINAGFNLNPAVVSGSRSAAAEEQVE